MVLLCPGLLLSRSTTVHLDSLSWPQRPLLDVCTNSFPGRVAVGGSGQGRGEGVDKVFRMARRGLVITWLLPSRLLLSRMLLSMRKTQGQRQACAGTRHIVTHTPPGTYLCYTPAGLYLELNFKSNIKAFRSRMLMGWSLSVCPESP